MDKKEEILRKLHTVVNNFHYGLKFILLNIIVVIFFAILYTGIILLIGAENWGILPSIIMFVILYIALRKINFTFNKEYTKFITIKTNEAIELIHKEIEEEIEKENA